MQQVVTIPSFDERGNLPSGIHKATIDDVVSFFGESKSLKRKQLAKNLKLFYNCIGAVAKSIYIDGSFVTNKISPGDIDMLIVLPNHLKFNDKVKQTIVGFQNNYSKYKLHIFVCFETELEREADFLNFFRNTRKDEKGREFSKGIISLETEHD